MKRLLSLTAAVLWPVLVQAEVQAPDPIQGAVMLLTMSYLCPTNDDAIVIDFAQEVLDGENWSERTAQQMFDTISETETNVTSAMQNFGCFTIERMSSETSSD